MNAKRQLKVGLFSIGLDAYWPQFTGLCERLTGYNGTIASRLTNDRAEIMNLGLIDTAEKAVLVMLDSPTSRHVAAKDRNPDLNPASETEKMRENKLEPTAESDSSKLPRQVIYHFSIGRAIPDPRIEA